MRQIPTSSADKPRRPRLFVGIALDEPTRAACANVASRLEASGFDARYEAAAKLHVTLAFLGNVECERVAEIERVLTDIALASEPFSLTLDKLGAFPNERRPRVVYVGSRDQGAAFRALAHRARERYNMLGFTLEDDAVAHVTIARVRGHGHPRPLPSLDVESISMHVGRIVLFESLPDATTTRYEHRLDAELRARA